MGSVRSGHIFWETDPDPALQYATHCKTGDQKFKYAIPALALSW